MKNNTTAATTTARISTINNNYTRAFRFEIFKILTRVYRLLMTRVSFVCIKCIKKKKMSNIYLCFNDVTKRVFIIQCCSSNCYFGSAHARKILYGQTHYSYYVII